MELTGAGQGLVKASISVTARNLGELPSTASIPVEARRDGGDPEVVHVVESIAGGEEIYFSFTLALASGEHSVALSMGDADAAAEVDARTADLTIEAMDYRISGDGFTSVDARVTNVGELSAESVVVSANWTSRDDGSTGGVDRAAAIERLDASQSEVVSLPIEIPTGAYAVTLSVRSDSLEATTDDNSAETSVEVDYVRLALSVDSVSLVGYETDGDGIVEVVLGIANEGKASSGQFAVGVVCADGAGAGCSQTLTLESIQPGVSAQSTLTLAAPQGLTTARAFAGALDNGYRWGPDNVDSLNIEVPDKAPLELAVNAGFAVKGYWPDGTADVELAIIILNEGYAETEDVQSAAVSCSHDGEAVAGCEGEIEAALPDGFASAPQTLSFRVPMDSVEFEFGLGGEEPHTLAFDVPERILGVDRAVWECFSDRPGIWADDEGCGGWYSHTIVKWPQDEPVKVWATGDDAYILVLEEVLDELSPLLNLDFERTNNESDADLKAYMGVPKFKAGGTEADCPEALGCANWDIDDDVALDAYMSVWLNESEWRRELGVLNSDIRHTTIHEILHAMVPIHHRTDPTSIVNITNALRLGRLGTMDEALIRLHSHPLVQPGMTMANVEEFIVFEDELLEPPPTVEPDGYELAWRAFAALQEAGSARFEMRGAWKGRGCDEPFGQPEWATYEIADFGTTHQYLVHFRDHSDNIYRIDSRDPDAVIEYWQERVRDGVSSWRSVDSADIFDDIKWRGGFTSPHIMLASILHFAEADGVEVSRDSAGEITLSVNLDKVYLTLPWTNREELKVVITLDEKTYQINEYSMDWLFHAKGASCPRFEMEAKAGEYGIEIEMPDAIREGSENLG